MNYLFLLFLGCLCLGSVSAIVGGQATTIAEAPFMVWLHSLISGSQYCSGTLYKDKYVITSAHCAMIAVDDLEVYAGSTYINETVIMRKAVKIHIHPKFISEFSINDIAVIELEKPVGGNAKSIPLCSAQVKPSDKMTIYGWGDILDGAGQFSNQLRKTDVSVTQQKDCETAYQAISMPITKDMFCMAASGKDACLLDSGGPAVRNGELCGIISWGNGCANPDFPGVYTNTYRFRAFINNFVNKKSTK